MKPPVPRSRRTYALTFLLAAVAVGSRAQMPAWVEHRPLLPGYYVGIGSAARTGDLSGDRMAARSQALNDIATQISVSISGETLREVIERNDSLRSKMTTLVRASAKADLDGVELAGTYEDASICWAYLRLDREVYRRGREEKVRAAAGVSGSLLAEAQREEQRGNTLPALRAYARTLVSMEKYLAEPVTATVNGRTFYVVQEAYTSMQRLLDGIVLQLPQSTRPAKIGKALKPPIEVTARRTGSGPVPGLPLQFSFVRGSGEMPRDVVTDAQGVGRCGVRKITSPERLQIVEARVDIRSLTALDSASLAGVLLSTLTAPKTRLMLDVAGMEVVFESEESVGDRPLEQKRIEPAIKDRLGTHGFTFVAKRDQAALLVAIKARARKGSETMGLSFAYVTVDISAIDLESGQEVFRKVLTDIKEGSDTFEKAALRGYATAATIIGDEMVPQLVARVQQ